MVFVNLDILRSIAMPAKVARVLDPPYVKKGSGIPVRGIKPTLAPIFKKACTVSHTTIPIASSLPSLSGALCAILNPLKKKNIQVKTKILPPRNPNSSSMIAKIESVNAVFSTR
jgi:hypothetical protein